MHGVNKRADAWDWARPGWRWAASPDLLRALCDAVSVLFGASRGKIFRLEGCSSATLSGTMYLLISFRQSIPPHNVQLDISINNSKQ